MKTIEDPFWRSRVRPVPCPSISRRADRPRPVCEHFLVMPNRKEGPLFWIQSVDDPAFAFVVTDPTNFFLDYLIAPDEQEREKLGINADGACYVLAIVSHFRGKGDHPQPVRTHPLRPGNQQGTPGHSRGPPLRHRARLSAHGRERKA